MNKTSSKLAAGVRKVKEQQKSAPAASKQTQPKVADRAEKLVVTSDRGVSGAAMHPTRIWPD